MHGVANTRESSNGLGLWLFDSDATVAANSMYMTRFPYYAMLAAGDQETIAPFVSLRSLKVASQTPCL